MEKLKENSIHISGTIVACWPQYGDEEETVDMTDIGSKFNGAYCINNSTICFIVDNKVFVTPYTRKALSTLHSAGLTKGCFYVPFSNGDYPKYEAVRWCQLRDLASESYYHDYETDSAKWCDEHDIGELSEETMKRCFKIPRTGVPVRHPYFEKICYPVCNECCVDSIVINKLGCYCANNGRVVFIYRDGHTYVVSGYWILEELRQAGYKSSSIFVPFSNGEEITDPVLAAQWNSVSKR